MQATILLVLSHSCLCLVFFFLRLLYIASIIRQNRLVICCKVDILKSSKNKKASKTISRVMSWTFIYPVLLLPADSSDQPEAWRAAIPLLFGLASDGVYICPVCYHPGGSLLHCPSNLTCICRRYISVALSLESPLPDVIRHPALWSPDFPRLRPFGTCIRERLSYLP